MLFKVTGITHEALTDFMFDLCMGHDISAFRIKKEKTGELILTVNKRRWMKTWKDTGCEIKDTKKALEKSFKDELEGQGHNVTVEIVETIVDWEPPYDNMPIKRTRI